MSSLAALSLPFLLASTLLHSTPAIAGSPEDCTCFSTTSSRGKTIVYGNYDYYDFTLLPSLLSSTDSKVRTLSSTPLTTNKTFTSAWSIQDWTSKINPEADFSVVNQVSNILPVSTTSSGDGGESQLLLRTYKPSGKAQQYAAEMENLHRNVFTASVRVNASIHGDPGAVIGIFFYRDSKAETDLEILTRDPKNIIRCTNQPALDSNGDEIPDSSTKAKIDGSWEDPHEWRIDWEEDLSSWFMDGKAISDKKYGVMKKPGYFVMNVWGDGGEWSGKMEEGGEAELRVSQVGMLWNSSELHGKDLRCKTICNVDDKLNFDPVAKTSTNASRVVSAGVQVSMGVALRVMMGALALFLVELV